MQRNRGGEERGPSLCQTGAGTGAVKLETHVSTLKDFEVYSESAEESLRIFKQIWKTSHNGRVGWRIDGSWKKQCRGI